MIEIPRLTRLSNILGYCKKCEEECFLYQPEMMRNYDGKNYVKGVCPKCIGYVFMIFIVFISMIFNFWSSDNKYNVAFSSLKYKSIILK